MTITGLVARNHSVSGFAADQMYFLAGAGQGGDRFTAYAKLRIHAANGSSWDSWIVGAHDGSLGWYFARKAGSGCVLVWAVDKDVRFEVDLDVTTVVDRSYLMELTVRDGVVTAWLDGAVVGRIAYTTPSTTSANFELGGTEGFGFNPCTESIINVGYAENVAYTEAQSADLFRAQRRFARPLLQPTLLYEADKLHAAEGVEDAPGAWVNSGSLGGSGDLELSQAGDLLFEDDPSPAYPGRVDAQNKVITQRLDIYVAPETGADNGEGTILSPLLSLQGAYNRILRISSLLAAPVVIHVAQGETRFVPVPDFTMLTYDAQCIIWCDGAGQSGEDGFQVINSYEAEEAYDDRVVVDATLTPNAFQGYSLRFTSGDAEGYIRDIRNNTDSTFHFVAKVGETLNEGDEFDVVLPATTFLLAAEEEYNYYEEEQLSCGTSTNITIINATFSVAAEGYSETLGLNTPISKLYGIKLTAGADITSRDNTAWGVTAEDPQVEKAFRLKQLKEALGLDISYLWEGWGVCALEGPITYYDTLQDAVGYAVMTGAMWLEAQSRGNFAWRGGSAARTYFYNVDVVLGSTSSFRTPVLIRDPSPITNIYLMELVHSYLFMPSEGASLDGSNQLSNTGVFRLVDAELHLNSPASLLDDISLDGGAGRAILARNSLVNMYSRGPALIEGDSGAVVLRLGSKFIIQSVGAEGSPTFSGNGEGPGVVVVDGSQFIGTNENPAGSPLNVVITGGSAALLLQDCSNFIKSHGNTCELSGQAGLLCEGGSRAHFDNLEVASSDGPGIRASLGASVDVRGACVVVAEGDGVDVTGGGDCSFGTGASVSITASGVELRVSPTESNTFATALAAAGDSYSNTGSGSSINRNL